MTHTTNWDGDCCFMKICRATSITWIFSSASTSYNFHSSMLNFKLIKWFCSPFFFSSSCFTQSLVNLQTSCLRSTIVSTMVIFSLNNGLPIGVVAFSMVSFLPNFPLPFPTVKSSYEWWDPSLKYDLSYLDLLTTPRHRTFYFAISTIVVAQLIGCPFHSTIQPLTNKTINSLLVICPVP